MYQHNIEYVLSQSPNSKDEHDINREKNRIDLIMVWSKIWWWFWRRLCLDDLCIKLCVILCSITIDMILCVIKLSRIIFAQSRSLIWSQKQQKFRWWFVTVRFNISLGIAFFSSSSFDRAHSYEHHVFLRMKHAGQSDIT